MNLPRLMFINEEFGNLKVVVDNRELTRIITERRSQFYKPIDVNSVTNALEEIEVSMIFLAVTVFFWREWGVGVGWVGC